MKLLQCFYFTVFNPVFLCISLWLHFGRRRRLASRPPHTSAPEMSDFHVCVCTCDFSKVRPESKVKGIKPESHAFSIGLKRAKDV